MPHSTPLRLLKPRTASAGRVLTMSKQQGGKGLSVFTCGLRVFGLFLSGTALVDDDLTRVKAAAVSSDQTKSNTGNRTSLLTCSC